MGSLIAGVVVLGAPSTVVVVAPATVVPVAPSTVVADAGTVVSGTVVSGTVVPGSVVALEVTRRAGPGAARTRAASDRHRSRRPGRLREPPAVASVRLGPRDEGATAPVVEEARG